jgi:hypothetical protein
MVCYISSTKALQMTTSHRGKTVSFASAVVERHGLSTNCSELLRTNGLFLVDCLDFTSGRQLLYT